MDGILELRTEKSAVFGTTATLSHAPANFSPHAIVVTAWRARTSNALLLFRAFEVSHTMQVSHHIGAVRRLQSLTSVFLDPSRSST
jgi:hypothetical protein